MKRAPVKALLPAIFACAIAGVILFFSIKNHRAAPPPASRGAAQTETLARAAPPRAPSSQSSASDAPAAPQQKPPAPAADATAPAATAPDAPTPVACAFWRLTPRELPPPPSDAGAQPERSESRAITVADLDTRAAAAALPQVKTGDDIELALPNGETARARVNLVTNDHGVLRLGGSLPGKQNASFALALDAHSQLSGMILLRDIDLAYTIEHGDHPGTSRMEATALSDILCTPYEDPAPPAAQPSAALASPSALQSFSPLVLSSRPAAPAVLYLEFNGATVTDPYWNNGNPIYAAAPNLTEAQITEIWRGVAEAYSPFNIDITTDPARYNSMPPGKRMRCIITPTYQWYTNSTSTRGVAYVNSFSRAGGTFASNIPCWIFVPAWYSYIPLVTAHELGHTLGLRHDGLTSASPTGSQEYFGGYGNDAMSWGPIMGNPSYRNINQWSKGEYTYANNTEDDTAIIANTTNAFGYYNDPIGKTRATATPLALPATGSTTQQGVITTPADEAWFTFTLAAPATITLAAAPADTAPKLDIPLQLLDAAGNVLLTDNPSLALTALIETPLAPATYYIKLRGTSYSDGRQEGYTRYGSLGQYTLTLAPATPVAAPTITQHPQSTTATTGDPAITLTAAATGPGTLRYQWQKDGVDLDSTASHPNVTAPTLTILSPTADDAGAYTLTARNAGGAATSTPATLTIIAPPPPVITTPPQSKTVSSADNSFTLTVTATGAGTLLYQWQKDGVALTPSTHYSGINNATLYVYDPAASDAGNYTVRVSNAGGSATSAPATITITLPLPPVIYTQPYNVTREAGDVASLTLNVSASGAGTLSYQWFKDGVALQPSPHYDSVTSYSLWIYDYMPEDSGRYSVRVTNKGGSVMSDEAVVTITYPNAPVITTQPSSKTALAGDPNVSMFVSASGAGLKYSWQKNGADLPSSNRYTGRNSEWLLIYEARTEDTGPYTVRVWNMSGTVTSNPATLTVNMPALPVINTSQAGAISAVDGESINLSCAIESVNNTKYQWYKDDQPIPGANFSTYYKDNATFDDSGVYTLAASNPSGTTISTGITVTVSPAVAPVFARQPVNQAAYAGRSVTLDAAATGRPAPSYQWYKNGVPIPYASGDTYYIYSAQASDSGSYTLVATNKAGTATSDAATLEVYPVDSGKALGIFPAAKEIGCGRVAYRVWIRSNAAWNVVNDTPWISVSRATGGYEGSITITVAPNPIPWKRTAVLTIAGIKHTLTQRAAGTPVRELWAAGDNSHGQLGAYQPQNPSCFKYVPMNIKSISTEGNNTLFLEKDGTLWGVGYNSNGQLGDGTRTDRLAPVQIATNVAGMTTNGDHGMFFKTDGTLWVMGNNTYGELGDGTSFNSRLTPVQVATDVVAVAAGSHHSLFLKSDGTLWGMGSNTSGQLGDGTTTQRNAPVKITSGVKTIAAAGGSTLFVKNDGTLWGAGSNYSGALGLGETASVTTPAQVAANVQSVYTNGTTTFFIKTDNTLWGMGGSIIVPSFSYQKTPVKIADDAVCAAIGYKHAVFIKSDGTLWALGNNENNQLGDEISQIGSTPVQIAPQAVAVFAGDWRTFYIDCDGLTWAAGRNYYGELGCADADGSRSSVPLHVACDAQAVATGDNHTLYLTTGSDVYSFGSNSRGQLADGTTRDRYAPMKVATSARAIAAGAATSLVINTDGALSGAGGNYNNQLGGQAQPNDRNTFVPIASPATSAAAAATACFYIDPANVLRGVGGNNYNELGVPTPGLTTTSIPIEIADNVKSVCASGNHTLVIKNDATLWTAGNNTYGELGKSDKGASTLAQVDTAVAAVAAGYYFSLWLKTDGSLWAVGYNDNGQFGSGPSSLSPTYTGVYNPVFTANNARAIAAGADHSLYIDTDNNLWASGYNLFGQLADGSTTNSYSYKKIAANVDSISAGSNHTLFIATGDIRLNPPPPPAVTGFSPAHITAQTKVTITGTNFTNCAGVYFGSVPADQFTVDSPTQITAYAPVIATEDNGHVYVGTFDGAAASPATYTASYPPMLGDHIEDQLVFYGDTATIEPPVLGAPDPAITWEISTDHGATWRPLPIDANHSVDAHGALKITNAPLSLDGNLYRFTATNNNGTITSAPFTLTIAYPPIVMTPPASKTVTTGAPVTFTADIEGSPAPALQWQLSTDHGLTWNNIANAPGITGATTATLQIAATIPAMDGRQYRLTATNDYGTITTAPATLTMQWPPVETNALATQTAVTGNTITLTATANASPAPNSYQWQLSTDHGATWANLANATGITGATTATLQIAPATTAINGNQYRCAIANTIGAITTQPVTLRITDSPLVTPAGLLITSATLYVTDADTHTIYRVALATGNATLLAGATGILGTTNATGTAARFNTPAALAITKRDNTLHVLDTGNNALRRVTMTGAVTNDYPGADFGNATGITVTSSDTLLIAQTNNHAIARIYYTGAGATTTLDIVSGATGSPGSRDDSGIHATYNTPAALAAFADGTRYATAIADTGNHTIRILSYVYGDTATPDTFYTYTLAGAAGLPGALDGAGISARFNRPAGIAGTALTLYVADTGNHTIRSIDINSGTVTTLAGVAGLPGFADGTGANARFHSPAALALDATDTNLYIADTDNSVIRKLNLATREVTTLALTLSATTAPVPPPPGGNSNGGGADSGNNGSGNTNGGAGGSGGNSGGGSGGGGAPGLWWLAAAALLFATRAARRRG